MNVREWKHRIFSAFDGDWDAEEALHAGLAIDSDVAHTYMDAAITKQLTTDYRTWVRSKLRRIRKDAGSEPMPRLFRVNDAPELRSIRQRVVIDGKEFDLDALSGDAGAEVLRRIAKRDEKAAKTMLSRCSLSRRLADALERAAAEGRTVTVAELLSDERAA